MKKMLLIMMICSLFLTANANQGNEPTSKDTKLNNGNFPPLPDGVYILCCGDGGLRLYDILGNLVGAGTDCGGLVGCVKCILNAPECDQSKSPTWILDLLNTMEPAQGEKYDGEWAPNMPEYCFDKGDIGWM